MSTQLAIAGFPSTDFVPGAYGIVKYGAGVTSAASIPLKLLCVGMKAANNQGTAVADTDITQAFDTGSADGLWGLGGQLTRMVQAALQIPGVAVWGAPVAVPNTPTQATLVVTVSAAAQTLAGTYTIRLAGETIQLGIATTDTTSTIATNLANAINAVSRLPMTATANGSTVTITVITPGAWGNTFVAYQDLSQCPGVTITLSGAAWQANTSYTAGSFVVPTVNNGFYFKATAVAGTHTSGSSEPSWPTTLGQTVIDNTGSNQITWTAWGKLTSAGGGTFFAGGAGVENVTNILAVINPDTYDRIAIGQLDATNLGRWKTQIDAQAGPLSLILQHAIAASNDTLAAATSLAQTTLNDQRFQMLWFLNSETNPTELAAVFGALRTQAEQADPDAAYDGVVLPGVAPQSQRQDWPTHATKVSALNNGVTPIETKNGQASMVRSITTRSLNGSSPDYSTLDTGEAVVPDFVLKDLLLYWLTQFSPSNPRVAPDPLPGQRPYVPGVGYPQLWNSYVTKKLRDYEAGNIGGVQGLPIIVNVDGNLPVSGFDSVANRIMSAVTVVPAPASHQIGVSVLQSAA